MLTGHSIQLGCIAADPIIRSDLDFLVFLDQSEHWSPPLVGEPKLPLEGRQGTWFNHLVSYLDLALSHCAPCNTFGEQREIYEWIGLFLSPPENKKAKFAFCTLKRNVQSTQKQPFLTVRFRGALLTKSVTLEFSQGTVCCDLLYLSIYADTCIYK